MDANQRRTSRLKRLSVLKSNLVTQPSPLSPQKLSSLPPPPTEKPPPDASAAAGAVALLTEKNHHISKDRHAPGPPPKFPGGLHLNHPDPGPPPSFPSLDSHKRGSIPSPPKHAPPDGTTTQAKKFKTPPPPKDPPPPSGSPPKDSTPPAPLDSPTRSLPPPDTAERLFQKKIETVRRMSLENAVNSIPVPSAQQEKHGSSSEDLRLIKELQEKVKQLEQQLSDERKNHETSLEKFLSEKEKSFKIEIEQQTVQVRSKNSLLTKKNDELQKSLDANIKQSNVKQSELTGQIESLDNEITNLNNKVNEEKSKNALLAKELHEIKTSDLAKELEDTKERLSEKELENNTLNNQVAEQDVLIKKYEAQIKDLTAELQQLQVDHRKAVEVIITLLGGKDEMKTVMSRLRKKRVSNRNKSRMTGQLSDITDAITVAARQSRQNQNSPNNRNSSLTWDEKELSKRYHTTASQQQRLPSPNKAKYLQVSTALEADTDDYAVREERPSVHEEAWREVEQPKGEWQGRLSKSINNLKLELEKSQSSEKESQLRIHEISKWSEELRASLESGSGQVPSALMNLMIENVQQASAKNSLIVKNEKKFSKTMKSVRSPYTRSRIDSYYSTMPLEQQRNVNMKSPNYLV